MTPELNMLAGSLLERHQALAALRVPWESLWKEIADYVMPRRSPGMNGGTLAPPGDRESRLFDTTAVQANMILANGCLAWMSPQESPWFGFEPPQGRDTDGARRWLSEATERTRQEMALSNFYTAIHEFYLDRSAFGTAALYVEPGMRHPLNVQCWPAGTFVIDEDAEGNVTELSNPIYSKYQSGDPDAVSLVKSLLTRREGFRNQHISTCHGKPSVRTSRPSSPPERWPHCGQARRSRQCNETGGAHSPDAAGDHLHRLAVVRVIVDPPSG